jgi:hypothetical protein
MKGYIGELGHAFIECNATELRNLYAAVEREYSHHSAECSYLQTEADTEERLAAMNRRGRRSHQRRAGELRDEAAGHAALAKEAADLRRVLHALTTDPDQR